MHYSTFRNWTFNALYLLLSLFLEAENKLNLAYRLPIITTTFIRFIPIFFTVCARILFRGKVSLNKSLETSMPVHRKTIALLLSAQKIVMSLSEFIETLISSIAGRPITRLKRASFTIRKVNVQAMSFTVIGTS